MTTTRTFNKDLIDGQAQERRLANFLSKRHGENAITFNDSKDVSELRKWDMILHTTAGKDIKIEVKNDIRAKQTGNIFIEYEDNGHPSGITATEADIMAYIIGDDKEDEGNEVLFIPTNIMRNLLGLGKPVTVYTGRTNGVLIRLDKIRRYAKTFFIP